MCEIHCKSCSEHQEYNSNCVQKKKTLSPKFKRVLLNETPQFPFWGLNICVDLNFRDSKKMENLNKINKIIFHNKNIDIHTTA